MPLSAHNPWPGRPRRLAFCTATLAVLLACAMVLIWMSWGSGASGDKTTYIHAATAPVISAWDPAYAYGSERTAFADLYETLTRYDPRTSRVEPLLATDWSSSNDGLTWTFKLREDVTFHSGAPLTAGAAEAAIERTMAVHARPSFIWQPVAHIAAPNEHTLTFTLRRPAPLALIASSPTGAYIYEVPDGGPEQAREAFQEHSYGTGPYTVARWSPGADPRLRLDRYPAYWKGWDGAHFEHVAFRGVDGPRAARRLLEAGEADSALLPPDTAVALTDDERIAVGEPAATRTVLALFNTGSGALKDERVRQALTYALDYHSLATLAGPGFRPSSGLLPPRTLPNGTAGPPGSPVRHDLAHARELLNAAGYGGERELRLELSYDQRDPVMGELAEGLRTQLGTVGVEVKTTGLAWESGQWPKALGKEDERQDIFLFSWYPNAPQAGVWLSAMFRSEEDPFLNLSYTSDHGVDRRIDEALARAATDPAAAVQMYRELEWTLADNTLFAPLGHQVDQLALGSGATGHPTGDDRSGTVSTYGLAPADS